MKKTVPLVLGIIFGVYAVAEFYIPHWAVKKATSEFQDWAVILAAAAYVIGGVSIIQVTWPKIRRRESDWQYKIVLLASAALMLLVGVPWHRLGSGQPTPTVTSTHGVPAPAGVAVITLDAPDDVMVQVGATVAPARVDGKPLQVEVPAGPTQVKLTRRVAGYREVVVHLDDVKAGDTITVAADPAMLWGKDGRLFKWMYDHVFAPCNATMFALLAFFVASAAFRAFRARNVEAALLLGAAILLMLGRAPIGRAIWDSLPDVGQWILDVPNNGGRRAIMMGAAVGAIATGLRVIVGLERSHLGAD